MKKTLFFLLLTSMLSTLRPLHTLAQSVAINADSSAPDASAILDLKSTIRGFLAPRMTLAQRNVIAVPAIGLLIYQTDNTPGFYYYDGATWSPVKGGGGGGSDPFWSANGNNLTNTNTGSIGIGTTTPIAPLTVQTTSTTAAFGLAHAGPNDVLLATQSDGLTAGIGTFSNTPMRLYSNSKNVLEINPATGHFIVGTGGITGEAQLTVYTPPPNGQYGLSHTNGDVVLTTYVGGGTYGAWFGTRSNHDLYFFTNSSPPRMAITADGYVGVAVEHPKNKFQIGDAAGFNGNDLAIGNGTQVTGITQTSTVLQVGSNTDMSFLPAYPTAAGHVGINVSGTPTNKLQIGDATGFVGNDIAFGSNGQASGIVQAGTVAEYISSTNIGLFPQHGSGSGRIGINTTAPRATLDVEGSAPLDYSGGDGYAYFAWGGNDINNGDPTAVSGGTNGIPPVSIYASNEMMAVQYDAFSDLRIKHIKGISDAKKDLLTLKAIEVTDYTFKDRARYGVRPSKKVIAQQVEKIYPQIVSKHVDFVPNVYQLTDSVTKVEGGYRLHFLHDHQLGDTAERIQAILSQQGNLQSFGIVSIPSPNEVIIDAAEITTNHVFVYGEEVPDFRTVDYEGLTTLNISATQELSREVADLKTALAAANANIRTLAQLVRKRASPPAVNRLTSVRTYKQSPITKQLKKI